MDIEKKRPVGRPKITEFQHALNRIKISEKNKQKYQELKKIRPNKETYAELKQKQEQKQD